MKVEILRKETIVGGTQDRVLSPGVQEVEDSLAKRLIVKGTAKAIEKKKGEANA